MKYYKYFIKSLYNHRIMITCALNILLNLLSIDINIVHSKPDKT